MPHVVAIKANDVLECTDTNAVADTKNKKKEMVGPSSLQYSNMFWILS